MSFKHAAVAAVAATLAACASAQTGPEQLSFDIRTMVAAMPAVTTQPVVSDFDEMSAALPTFHLERSYADLTPRDEVSVSRDIVFATDSSILSATEVNKLEPLIGYLRKNPSVTVRIEGYGDGINSPEREADLSSGRAQAVSRALLKDISVFNTINAIGAVVPQAARRHGNVEIIFIEPPVTQG